MATKVALVIVGLLALILAVNIVEAAPLKTVTLTGGHAPVLFQARMRNVLGKTFTFTGKVASSTAAAPRSWKVTITIDASSLEIKDNSAKVHFLTLRDDLLSLKADAGYATFKLEGNVVSYALADVVIGGAKEGITPARDDENKQLIGDGILGLI